MPPSGDQTGARLAPRAKNAGSAGFDPSTWGVPDGDTFRPFVGDYNGLGSTNTFAALTWTGFAPPQPYNLEIDYATAAP